MLQALAPYITIISAIIAAYLTYKNQMRIKSFEILYIRQQEILKDIESFITKLYEVKLITKSNVDHESIEKYLNEYFHEGLMLHHKIKGANFGEATDLMSKTFFSIIMEPSSKQEAMSKEDFYEWVARTANILAMTYSTAHAQLTKDIEKMAFSYPSRIIRARRAKLTNQSSRPPSAAAD